MCRMLLDNAYAAKVLRHVALENPGTGVPPDLPFGFFDLGSIQIETIFNLQLFDVQSRYLSV